VLGFCLKIRGSSPHQSTSFRTSWFVCRYSSSCVWGILQFLVGIGRRATMMRLCIEGIWWIFEDRSPIVIYSGYFVLSPAKFESCVLLDTKINGASVSPTLTFELTSISMLLSSSISPYLCLPSPVRSVHFSIEVFWWRIAVQAMLRGVNEMLGICSLPHQPYHTFSEVSTPIFDTALVIVIPSHILGRV